MVSIIKVEDKTIIWCTPREIFNIQNLKESIRIMNRVNKETTNLLCYKILIKYEGNISFTAEGKEYVNKIIKIYYNNAIKITLSYEKSSRIGYFSF